MPIVCESEDEFRKALVHGAVLYFPCPTYLSSIESHYFVIVTLGHPNYYFCCSTSQNSTVEELIARHKFTEETFIWVNPNDADNPFTTDSFLNCNEFFHFTFSQLWDIHEEGVMTVHSPLSEDPFSQIINGYQQSQTIDDDFKEMLPQI